MSAGPFLMWKRQSGDGTDFANDNINGDSPGDDQGSWWWSPAGFTVRYIIVAVVFGALLLFFVGGYYHANRRVRKGLAPLPYHRWMVQRRVWGNEPRYNQYAQYPARFASQGPEQGQTYRMEGYAPPPPAYNSELAPPPAYQPPQGGSKVMADQSYPIVQERGAGESSTGIAAPPPARHHEA
nr:hypothetical protein CFP56_50322 [Quercus suber]